MASDQPHGLEGPEDGQETGQGHDRVAGDVMDVLEHWVCENCDSVDPPTFNGDEKACGICADEGGNGLLVKLVPASQLRGAVQALDAVRVWLASPQRPRDRLRGIERALIDPEYAAQIAALKGQ